MTERSTEQYPVIEKTIPLEKADYERIRRTMSIEQSIREEMVNLLIRACTKIEDRKTAQWDELAKRFGYSGIEELQFEGKTIELSWANRQLNLRGNGKTAL